MKAICVARRGLVVGGTVAVLVVLGMGAWCPVALAQTPPQGVYDMTLTLSDLAQQTTLAFDGLALMTGNVDAQSFFPPGKVADYTGFQYLRDNDPDNMGHNTSFLTRIANDVISILTDGQFAQLKALAATQAAEVNLYGYKRYPLMQAFRRLADGNLPAGATGLGLEAVTHASHDLYLIDGQIAFERALLYATIYRSMTSTQTAYLDAMKGRGFNSWPDVPDAQIAPRMASLPQGTATLVMTYASDLFSWYAGSLDADVYFCPERHGTYYGGFYIKDAPAVGHEGYSISEQLTNTAGSALSDSSLGYATPDQAAWMTSLVAAQRDNLYAGATNIVSIRTQIATLLRSLLVSTTSSEAIRTQVLDLSGTYGELDGEDNYLYATVFAKVWGTMTSSQKARLTALRQSLLSGTYADGTPYDYSVCTTPFLYSDPIPDVAVLQPYLADTDSLFAADAPLIMSFTATPRAIAAGRVSTLTWHVVGAARITIDNGVGDVSGATTAAVSPADTTRYMLTASNAAGSVSAQTVVDVAACKLVSAPSRIAVEANESATATISCGAGAFAVPASLAVHGAPPGVTASVTPVGAGAGRALLTVTAAGAAPGTYMLTLSAGAASSTVSVSLPLVVNPVRTITLTLSLGSRDVNLAPGGAAQVAATAVVAGPSASAVVFSCSGAARGLTVAFSPSAGAATTVTVRAVAAMPAGTYKVTIRAAAGGQTATQALVVTVQPGSAAS